MIRDKLYDTLIYALNKTWNWRARRFGARMDRPGRSLIIHKVAVSMLAFNRSWAKGYCCAVGGTRMPDVPPSPMAWMIEAVGTGIAKQFLEQLHRKRASGESP